MGKTAAGASVKYRRSPQVGFEVVGDRVRLSPPEADQPVDLNEVGTMVWAAIEPARSATEVAAILHPGLDGVTLDELTVDIAEFLSGLAVVGWVEQVRNGATP